MCVQSLRITAGFLPVIFSGGPKSIVMQIYFIMLIFLLLSDQISGGKSLWGGQTTSGGAPVEESQTVLIVCWSYFLAGQ